MKSPITSGSATSAWSKSTVTETMRRPPRGSMLPDLAAEFHRRADLMERGDDEITAAAIAARGHS
jgi:hypothetical protein